MLFQQVCSQWVQVAKPVLRKWKASRKLFISWLLITRVVYFLILAVKLASLRDITVFESDHLKWMVYFARRMGLVIWFLCVAVLCAEIMDVNENGNQRQFLPQQINITLLWGTITLVVSKPKLQQLWLSHLNNYVAKTSAPSTLLL